jgi:hypothetical protein
VLHGDLTYTASIPRLPADEERIVLLAMHQTLLVERGLCLRETAIERLQAGKKNIDCLRCDDPNKRIPLWDELEQRFASPDIQQRVREL